MKESAGPVTPVPSAPPEDLKTSVEPEQANVAAVFVNGKSMPPVTAPVTPVPSAPPEHLKASAEPEQASVAAAVVTAGLFNGKSMPPAAVAAGQAVEAKGCFTDEADARAIADTMPDAPQQEPPVQADEPAAAAPQVVAC